LRVSWGTIRSDAQRIRSRTEEDSVRYPARLHQGQVEYQVGVVRERFFTPRLRVKSYEELNVWLLDRCIAYARAHRHPEFRDRCSRWSGRAWSPMPADSVAGAADQGGAMAVLGSLAYPAPPSTPYP
jgi:hypothetical protein